MLSEEVSRLVEVGYLEMLRGPLIGRPYVVASIASSGVVAFIARLNQKKEQAVNLINQRAAQRFLRRPHTDTIKGCNGIHELRTHGGIRFYYFFDGATVIIISHASEHVDKRRVLREGKRAEAIRTEYEIEKARFRKDTQ